MRILSITHSYGQDGAAMMLRAAIRHWTSERNWRVDAVCSPGELQKFDHEFAECGATPLATVDLRSYDVILVNTAIDAGRIDALTLDRPGLPIVLWIHEGLSVLRNSNEPISAWLRRFSKCRLVIYQTTWQRDLVFRSFAALLPPERMVVVPDGISVVHAPPRRRLEADTFRIVCVGSVTGLKRQADLVKVLARLSEELRIECEFIGNLAHAASAGPEVVALIDNPPAALTWSGTLPHPETLERVSRADLLCHPSSDESFALAPLEAATRGVPVLLSRLPPYQYIGWRDEENCLQHGVGNLRELESQIRRMIARPDLRARIGAAGKRLADGFPLEASLGLLTDAVATCAEAR